MPARHPDAIESIQAIQAIQAIHAIEALQAMIARCTVAVVLPGALIPGLRVANPPC